MLNGMYGGVRGGLYSSYSIEKLAFKIVDVKPLRGGMMLVTFSTGEKRLFDTTLLQGPVFEVLSDESVFSKPVLFHGVITWNNGEIDIAPETVYRDSYTYEDAVI